MTYPENNNSNRLTGRRLFLCIVMCLSAVFLFTASPASQHESVVIITSNNSQVEKMSVMEVRRLYLGLPPIDNRSAGKAIINLSDKKTYNLFLKNIMHMTEYRYKRRLVKRVFRYGSSAIKEIDSIGDIESHLDANNNDITFVEISKLGQLKNTKVILRLW